ncbi:MBL fold metallo-hydrolase [Bacillus spongiae]|uniref:MBL fold metallo-hydrolase n=1 Tax=Bacillus spongiae TaxID=2683610 RepID=A0ABU8HBT8_9BACI
MSLPTLLQEDIYLIDGLFLEMKERTGSYVIKSEKPTIIETCTSSSVPYILQGLSNLDLSPEEIEYIIVTHIHLDHAGGVGLLLQHCPNAKVVVHPKGARHLVDPTKLILGAKAVYGKHFNQLFDPIIPVKEENILIMNEEDELEIGEDRTLRFYDTPGHANHHFCIFDSKSKGIFSGDTLGSLYGELEKAGLFFSLPITSPNQYDPEKMLLSAMKLENLDPHFIYFGHYGMTRKVTDVFEHLRHWLPQFTEASINGLKKNTTDPIPSVKLELMEVVSNYLSTKGIPPTHPIYHILEMDMSLNAMGLVDYISKNHSHQIKP